VGWNQVNGFFSPPNLVLPETDSVRRIDFSVSANRVVFTPLTVVFQTVEYHSHQHPPHVHDPHSCVHTGPWVFFETKPLPLWKQILRDLLTIVYLTTE
jgi:hypothetical protein